MGKKFKKELREVINEVIKKDARKEAYEVMTKCDEKYVKEFFMYYNKKSFNVVPLVIDSAKSKLVKDRKMKRKKNDHFGLPEFEFDVTTGLDKPRNKLDADKLKKMVNDLISKYKK